MNNFQNNIVLISFFLLLILQSCKSKQEQINVIDKESKIISDYKKEGIKIKGDSAFFIAHNDISVIFPDIFILLDDVRANDIICFFDNQNNIIYQALVQKRIDKSFVILDYDNLSTAENVVDTFSINMLYKLKPNSSYIKGYRHVIDANKIVE